jgi:hypothetical protein
MYEVMRYWETAPTGDGEPSAGQEYAKIWQAADKIVYSRSLESAASSRTRIEREFDPEAIRLFPDETRSQPPTLRRDRTSFAQAFAITR